MKIPTGLYENVIDEKLAALIDRATEMRLRVETRALDAGDSHAFLLRYLLSHMTRAFQSVPAAERLERQIDLTSKVLDLLAAQVPGAFSEDGLRALQTKLLLAILESPVERPDTPLSSSCLMTGTRQDPSLASQLKKEIGAADSVDILCSFIKWSGVRILGDALKRFAESGRPLRIITTPYLGATDLKAVDFLCALPGAELRISYDTRRTRLHAKAYIMHRSTGLGSAYIGSSNLSHAALTDGLEWNMKISQDESPHLWSKIAATFETYWNDGEFVAFSPLCRERLRTALGEERDGYATNLDRTFIFDIRPYPYQEEILQKLEVERAIHRRSRNLVVAATGTGKTVVAAFDYARFQRARGGKASRLLFVAHREEILKQSLACFRAVLGDLNFGDLLVGGHEPRCMDHLFVSIQSFNSREMWQRFDPGLYQFIVVDEFHHASAPGYRRLLDWACPEILLGLTATPERHDDLDVCGYFDGRIAAEIRLPDAINRKLLCPFQYFGVTDCVDFSGLRWTRGGYAAEDLDGILTGDDARAALILKKTREILLEPRRARGLGFCVSVRHAEFMAEKFTAGGIPAVALSGESPRDLRESVLARLKRYEINFIFVVDIYNEGVDIPEVDTILLLRPTESLTVFLQQLGRGLRLHRDKDCLTVLDFIGQAHVRFNFEGRFRSLLPEGSRDVEREMKEGFSHLPAGCAIHLELVARDRILENIEQCVGRSRSSLVRRIASFEAETGRKPTLLDFIRTHRLELDEIYERDCWSRLCVLADVRGAFAEPDTDRLARGLRRIQHVDGVRQIRALLETLPRPGTTFVEPGDLVFRRLVLMLHFSLWGPGWLPQTLAESVDRLAANPVLLEELRELLLHRLDSIEGMGVELDLPFSCPLELHSHYTRDEILAALGVRDLKGGREVREGVLFIVSLAADVFFITLNKTEKDYSPSTMYEDYAISDVLFHWQSQSTTSAGSPTGQRYIHHRKKGGTVLLFVRENRKQNGLALPYCCIGPAEYVSHEGSRPMNIIWHLRHPLPARLIRKTARLKNA